MDQSLLRALSRERRMEREARRGKAFADRDFWDAYVQAVVDRRAAVDAYFGEHPEPVEAEAESVEMFG